MEEKYFDFDEAMAERQAGEKPFIVKAFGEKYEIPNDVPFDVILMVQRAHSDGQNTFSEDQVIELCHVIFGEETFKKWLTKGITMAGIMIMMENVMSMYMGKADKTAKSAAAAKEEQIPNP